MPFYENPKFNQKYVPATYATLNEWYEATKDKRTPADPLGFDPIPYLCQLLKTANLPEVEPVITMQSDKGFDYENYLSTYFKSLTSIGDNRVNFYETWEEISKEYLPKVLTQIELAQSGGCQVVDGYICNKDGIKIKEASSTCKEGDEYLQPIVADDIINKTKTFVQQKRELSADSFITYIQKKYLEDKTTKWTLTLHSIDDIFVFYAQLEKDGEMETEDFIVENGSAKSYYPKQYSKKTVKVCEYLKHYQDTKLYVSEKLNVPIISMPHDFSAGYVADGKNLITVLTKPMPDYSVLLSNL
jgi:hypothetical protein